MDETVNETAELVGLAVQRAVVLGSLRDSLSKSRNTLGKLKSLDIEPRREFFPDSWLSDQDELLAEIEALISETEIAEQQVQLNFRWLMDSLGDRRN